MRKPPPEERACGCGSLLPRRPNPSCTHAFLLRRCFLVVDAGFSNLRRKTVEESSSRGMKRKWKRLGVFFRSGRRARRHSLEASLFSLSLIHAAARLRDACREKPGRASFFPCFLRRKLSVRVAIAAFVSWMHSLRSAECFDVMAVLLRSGAPWERGSSLRKSALSALVDQCRLSCASSTGDCSGEHLVFLFTVYRFRRDCAPKWVHRGAFTFLSHKEDSMCVYTPCRKRHSLYPGPIDAQSSYPRCTCQSCIACILPSFPQRQHV